MRRVLKLGQAVAGIYLLRRRFVAVVSGIGFGSVLVLSDRSKLDGDTIGLALIVAGFLGALAPLVHRVVQRCIGWIVTPEAPRVRRRLLAHPAGPLAGAVLIMPESAYHVDEAAPLAAALLARGQPAAVLSLVGHWSRLRHRLSEHDVPVFRAPEPKEWLRSASGVVVFNDWGGARKFVECADELGVPTFAKVEGAQDFNDDDVEVQRNPYRTARFILCQGQNDVAALPEMECVIVGSSRLERIFNAPVRPTPSAPLVVVNLNFTYGVLQDAQEPWIESVLAACKAAGLPVVISMHPAQELIPQVAEYITAAEMRHLLESASVLISRFSTVPFEAMARGVPFIYHNPHGERVPVFKDPSGAFPITDDTPSLVAALASVRDESDYRATASEFFSRQVSVVPRYPSEDRAADFIVSRV